MHDRIAELSGLRAELANCINGPRPSRRDVADLVREQIARVRGELDAEAEGFEERAADLAEAGQDVPAAAAASEARRIREALDLDAVHDEPAPAPAPAATEPKRSPAGKPAAKPSAK